MKSWLLASVCLGCCFAFLPNSVAQTLGPDFAADYSFVDLGAVPGLPPSYGGLTFQLGDPNTILIGGAANTANGRLHEVGVVRDVDGHITGFTGTAIPFGDVGEFNDGGVVFGPNDVLFTAQWPSNNLGQTKLGSTDEDKVVALGPLGVSGSSISALEFVPIGFAGAGQMKLVTWSSGNWYSATFSPDGNGTFDITAATLEVTIPGGPEGFVYIDDDNAGFSANSILVSDYSSNRISAYEVDTNGDPIVASRRDFLTGLTGAEGAAIDPITGDFLFSTFGGGDRVIAVRGFIPIIPEPSSLVLLGLVLLTASIAARTQSLMR